MSSYPDDLPDALTRLEGLEYSNLNDICTGFDACTAAFDSQFETEKSYLASAPSTRDSFRSSIKNLHSNLSDVDDKFVIVGIGLYRVWLMGLEFNDDRDKSFIENKVRLIKKLREEKRKESVDEG